MKRLIKFRGKRVDTGEWIFGYYLEFSLCDGEGRCSYIKVDGCQPIKVDPDTVCQFTGLLDKNGKEIYEGDILNNGQRNYFVCWSEARGAWWLKNMDLIYTQPLGFLSTELFIIGNIHDNPELLKGGNQ